MASLPTPKIPFQPGNKLAKGGKKPGTKDVAFWLRNTHGERLIKRLLTLSKSKEPTIALKASCYLADRAFGKALQAIAGADGGPLVIHWKNMPPPPYATDHPIPQKVPEQPTP